MNPAALASLAIFVAYMVGAIPFAYVIVRLRTGVDIRTVGSGNVGATNAARVLGLRGFVLVFLCDLLKGLIPTLALPWITRRVSGEPFADLPILVALATILGHNFPVYLNFKGGKGVATSLGATFALAPIASLAAVLAFGVSLRASRYISLSSMIGAVVFAVTHFLFVVLYEHKHPFDRQHVALSVLTLGLLLMLIVRHRENWSRIREGTEPKVGRGRKRESGRAAVVVLVLVALVGVAAMVAARMSRQSTIDCGAFTLVDLGRAKTGHQRASSPAFSGDGKSLAVLCPRYDRLMIYGVEADRSPMLANDVLLDGQPMALASSGDRFWVLERPSGDERHMKPGHVQGYSQSGEKLGRRITVGFYPTSMTVIDGGKVALVLTAGRSEGDPHHGVPALEVLDLAAGRVMATVPFDRPGDWPWRVSASSSGGVASVVVSGADEVAAIDLSDRSAPKLLGRTPLPTRGLPYPSIESGDWILMPVATDRECAVIASTDGTSPMGGVLATVRTESSELEVFPLGSPESLGRLPLRGSAGFGDIRPTGVACSPDGRLLAVTSRSGGVHLVAIRPKPAVASRSVVSR